MSQEEQQSDGAGLPSLTFTVKVILPNLMSQQLQAIKYDQKAALGLGIVQMILGIVCIISNSVTLATSKLLTFPSEIAYGCWGGLMFAVAGLFEVLSSRKAPNIRLIIGSMVMSVVAACAGAIVLGLGIMDAANLSNPYNNSYYGTYDPNSVQKVFAIILTIAALAEIVISIIGSAVTCGTFCRKYSLNIPIHTDGKQLVMGNPSSDSYYQALVKPPN